MQKLYYWLGKSLAKDRSMYDIKHKLNNHCTKAFTQKELDKIESETFLMDKCAQEQWFLDILINMKVQSSKKTLGLLHYLIKALPIKTNV